MDNVNAITEEAISGFYGSRTLYRHPLVRNVILTEGCAFLSSNGADWLIDEIAKVQNTTPFIDERFQCWKLFVDRDSSTAVLLANDGDGDGHMIYKQLIPYTVFPLKSIKLFCCASGDAPNGKIIMLANEY